ncbi:MAG: YitT family protein [Clostridia bacterium]|nr:YitT family protein [Clostridia bacterium]
MLDGKKLFSKKNITDFWVMTLGALFLTVGVYFFKIPNGFSTGGVSGIGTILGALIPRVSTGLFISLINAALLLVGLAVFGRGFGFKTVYCSLLFSGLTMVFEWLAPLKGPITDEPLLDLVCAILLTSIGSALMFRAQASSGGTDIVAMILKKYTSLDIGKALLVTDFLIAASAFLVFDLETGIFSLLGLFAKAFVVDSVIESIGTCKYFTIVTTKKEEIGEYIMNTIHHGFTELHGLGGFTGEDRYVLLTVCKRIEGTRLRKFCKEVDPHAFLIVSNTSEIIGKGFRAV